MVLVPDMRGLGEVMVKGQGGEEKKVSTLGTFGVWGLGFRV